MQSKILFHKKSRTNQVNFSVSFFFKIEYAVYALEGIRVRQIIHSSSGHHFGNVEFSSIQEPYCNYKHKYRFQM